MFLSPFLPNPFSDLFAILLPNYAAGWRNDLCAKLSMRLYNCVEAHGSNKCKEKCLDLFYDLYECNHRRLQKLRVKEIQNQRKRKYKAGEIDELYSEKPPHESYFYI